MNKYKLVVEELRHVDTEEPFEQVIGCETHFIDAPTAEDALTFFRVNFIDKHGYKLVYSKKHGMAKDHAGTYLCKYRVKNISFKTPPPFRS